MSFEIWLEESETYLEEKEYDKALEAINKISKIHPRSRWVSLRKAEILYYKGAIKSSIRQFKKAKASYEIIKYVEVSQFEQGSGFDPKMAELIKSENEKLMQQIRPDLVKTLDSIDFKRSLIIISGSLIFYLIILLDLLFFDLDVWSFGPNIGTDEIDYERKTIQKSLFFLQSTGFGLHTDCIGLNFRNIIVAVAFFLFLPALLIIHSTRILFHINTNPGNINTKVQRQIIIGTIAITIITILVYNLINTVVELKLYDSLELLNEQNRELIMGNYALKNFVFLFLYLFSFVRELFPDLKFIVYPVLIFTFFGATAYILTLSSQQLCEAALLEGILP